MNYFAKKSTEMPIERLKTWTKLMWSQFAIEPKINGLRLIIIDGQPTSINGKPYHNLRRITEAVKKNKSLNNIVLDGELINTDWNMTMSLARSSETMVDDTLAKFMVFDAIHIAEYNSGVFHDTYSVRRDRLWNIVDFKAPLQLVPMAQVGSFEAFNNMYADYLKLGYEGVVMKHIHSVYDFKRNTSWYKVKPTYSADVKIIGMNEGNGKYKNMLGSLIIMYKGDATNVGGMSDAMRTDMWDHKSKYIGKMCEVEYKSVTKRGKLYAPEFKRMRPDKDN